MAKWDAALYGEKILKKSSLDQMWGAVRLNNGKTHPYGFGWGLGETQGRRFVQHSGAWQGFRSCIARFVDDKLTVVILANLAQANPDKIVRGVAQIYNPELTAPAVKAIEDKEPKVTALVKELVQKFAEGTADPNLFTPEARAVLFSERAKQFDEFLKSLGAPGLVELVERKEENGNRVYRYRLTFRASILFWTIWLTKEDKIAAIQQRLE